MKIENNVVSAQTEGRTNQSVELQNKREIISMVDSYLETLENVWDAPQEVKDQEYRKLRLLLKYQLALSCPVSLPLSMMDRKDKEEAGSTDGTKEGRIYLPTGLRKKVELAAKELNCTENETVSAILTEAIGKYLKTEEKESEESDGIDI